MLPDILEKAFPQILRFSSFLKNLDNNHWCSFPELFCRCEKPPSNGRTIDDLEHIAQASWSPRTGSVTPPCYLTISQSENHTHADHIYHDTASLPALWKCFVKTLWWPWGFRGLSHLGSLHDLAINLSLLQALKFPFVWPHCPLCTQACVNTTSFLIH